MANNYVSVSTISITKEEYDDLDDCHGGFCLKCKEFVFDGCEPDAFEYECPECGARKVMGIESAVLFGHVKVIFND